METRDPRHARLSRREVMVATAIGVGTTALAACGGAATQPPAPATAAPEAAQATSVPAEAVAATAAPGGEKVKVTYWGPSLVASEGEQLSKWAQYIIQFTEESQDVDLETLEISDQHEKIITAVAGGNPPDLFNMDRNMSGEFAARGLLMPLDEFYAASAVVNPEAFWSHLIRDISWNGKKWAVPRVTDVRAMFLNDELLGEAGLDPASPPATWTDIEAAIGKLYQSDDKGEIVRLGFTPSVGNPPGWAMWYIFLWQLGGMFLTEDNAKVAFDSDAGVQALEWMVKVNDMQGGYDKVIEFSSGLTPAPGQDIFMMGLIAMYISGCWMLSNYKKYTPDLKYTVAALPLPEGGEPHNYAGGWTLAIPNGAAQPAGAWKVIEYLMAPERHLDWALDENSIPVYESVAKSPEYLDAEPTEWAPARRVFVDELPGSRWVPTIPGGVEILAVNQRMYDEALRKVVTPKEAITAAAADVQAILDEWQEKIKAD